MLEVTKSHIPLYKDTAMLVRETNFEILSLCKAKIMPQLNHSYCHLIKGATLNYFLGIIYQSKSKKHPKLTHWSLQFKKSSLPRKWYHLTLPHHGNKFP